MKMTRLALAGKFGCFGRRSYVRSFANADSAANIRSCCSMEFTAIAPNPTAASCNACLRVKNRLMAFLLLLRSSVNIQEVIGPEHRLDKQPETFLGIRLGGDRLLRDFLLSR